MARGDYLFTSESVSEGHPDKVCDRISDEVVDLFFREGANAGKQHHPSEGAQRIFRRRRRHLNTTQNDRVFSGEAASAPLASN